MLENISLLFCSRPILLLDSLGKPRELKVRIGVTRAIKNVLEPRASGDAVRVEPVALDLHQALVESGGESLVEGAGRKFSGDSVVQLLSRGFELVNGLLDFAKIHSRARGLRLRALIRARPAQDDRFVAGSKFGHKLADVAGVSSEIVG